jgi:putative membrane protein
MRSLLTAAALLLAGLTSAERAHAHSGHEDEPTGQPSISAHRKAPAGPRSWNELAGAWELEPWVVIPLAVSACLYAQGLNRMWRDAGAGHGVRSWEAAAFWGGWFTLVAALISPLHRWGGMLFSAHMTQHELLMLLAAPLLVLGKPLVAMLKALPRGWARTIVHWTSAPWWRRVWHFLINPFVAWLIHAIVLWAWHLPALFQATLTSNLVHALQHLSFVLCALLFWWAVTQGPHRAVNFGAAVLYMFTTALHSGFLGALITFASSPWYPAYAETAPAWGLTALEDQQLGGAIMWIPACTVYIIAGLTMVVDWLRSSDQRVRSWEATQLIQPMEADAAI